ncbi:UDP-glucose--hexose-1-phosphate uridylyltransferase [Bacillus sp. HMF5848]|uniref:UDP-glucose--hexose-1-phosphate uridylyltransferase n=1 Tax=Bacillus sp. HMF5848 TaxID=2495421 RepID=UPI000F7AE0D8|nr:UDP-glucose--hexose-1-phosphate uridylyltransferase [Bacillus sp. HMF5848]RSK26239.1 UDP-glucose--hexose-1-phosphate uridylyltransferase [Bacillus sp. HMF5848]
MNIYVEIERLLHYGMTKKLIETDDLDFTRNQLLAILELADFEQPAEIPDDEQETPVEILNAILDWAYENGRIRNNTTTERDLLDTKIMGVFVSRPSDVINKFFGYKDVTEATNYLYQLSKDSLYIRTDRIAKNEHWFADTNYGQIEITINLSKPEKDPKEIAAAKQIKNSSYPECLLCKENVGYAGRLNHPARQNLRTIPVDLDGEKWHLQFSPYVYYNEHAIVLKDSHEPMKISKRTFERLLAFTSIFPHYFLGSNADLPIVGGSILSHDHFQGGNHDFPMAKAEIEFDFQLTNFPHTRAGIVKWPMSVVRLQSLNLHELVDAADYIFRTWREYSDESVDIHAFTNNTPHNTITPIARRRGEMFELDLVLRNNRTSEKHPMGIFHPHDEVHHIKKENIGLIEVMGLAVLPGRLKEELKLVGEALVSNNPIEELKKQPDIQKHADWAIKILEKHPDETVDSIDDVLKKEIGIVFTTILEHAGVFKRDERGVRAFKSFIESL